jgi:hypothetical protein
MVCGTGPASLHAAHFHMHACSSYYSHRHAARSTLQESGYFLFFYLPRSLQSRRNLNFILLIVFMASSTLFQMSGGSVVDDFVFMTEPIHPYNLVWILLTSTVISIFIYLAGLFLGRTGGFPGL